jgi:serine/threonine protein kinase
LEYLHANGVVHGDIKPQNIIVDSSETVTLIDFGVSSDTLMYTTIKAIVGTRPYIAPEVLKNMDIKLANDIWSFGIVLAEMVVL